MCGAVVKELAIQNRSSGKVYLRSNVYIKMEVQGVEHRGGHYGSGSDRRRPRETLKVQPCEKALCVLSPHEKMSKLFFLKCKYIYHAFKIINKAHKLVVKQK